MGSLQKKWLAALVSVAVIAASLGWIYYSQFKAPRHNVPLHQEVGRVMAQQTAKALGRQGKVLVVTIPARDQPELQTQLDAFRRTLRQLGDFEVKEHELDTKNQPKYGVGAGLSGRRFARLVKNHPEANAIVSFVGAPRLSADEISTLAKCPVFLAESRSVDHLQELFDHHILAAAVVSRFIFPAPGPARPVTAADWFQKRYQVLSADGPKIIPASE